MIRFTQPHLHTNIAAKANTATSKTAIKAQEDLSHLARFNPGEESYYHNHDVIDFGNKTKASWSLPNGKSIDRYELEKLASDGPVEVSFNRRVPDTSQPKRSKLRRLAQSVGVGTATTLGMTAFPFFLLMGGDKLLSTFSQTYTDAKYPWKSETVQGQYSTEDSMGFFQPKGMEKVEMGNTIEFLMNQ